LRSGAPALCDLVACLTYGVLEGEVADEIRRDLIAAREAENRRNVPASRMAAGLMIFRTYEPTADEPAIGAVLHDPAGLVEGVLLAGRIFVSWSSVLPADVPRADRRLSRRLLVGFPVKGTVHPCRRPGVNPPARMGSVDPDPDAS
jgi:hypothetical protein